MARYIRVKQLKEDYGIDRVTAWRWAGDPSKNFPRPVRLSSGVSVYEVAEVDAWFAARKSQPSAV